MLDRVHARIMIKAVEALLNNVLSTVINKVHSYCIDMQVHLICNGLSLYDRTLKIVLLTYASGCSWLLLFEVAALSSSQCSPANLHDSSQDIHLNGHQARSEQAH